MKHITNKYVPLAPDELHAVDERGGEQSDLRPQGTEPGHKFADFLQICCEYFCMFVSVGLSSWCFSITS